MTALSFGQVIPVTGPNLGFAGTISRQGERVVPSREFSPLTSTNNLNFGDPAVIIENATGGYYTSVYDFITSAAANAALVVSQFAGIAVREVQTQLAYPYGAGVQPGTLQVGYYAPGQMADVLERGSATVYASVVNSAVAGSQVYTRVVLNGAITAGTIGDWEIGTPAATDQFSTTGTAAAIGTALTIASATNTQNGQLVYGFGIAPGTYVASGGGTTAIVLSQNTTAIIPAGTPVTFSNLAALPNTVARTGFMDVNNMMEITVKVRNAA